MSAGGNKDLWDKIGSFSGVIATSLIAVVGLYFTHTYEMASHEHSQALEAQAKVAADHNRKLRELEAVERLLPHLSSEETTANRQKLAILALRELGNQKLAIQFAEVLGTEGATAALRYTAETSDSKEEQELAKKALGRLIKGAGGDVGNPELDQIVEALKSLQGKVDDFLIFEKDGTHYMQTDGGPDKFMVEYREGSSAQHYRCDGVSRSVVIQMFQTYAKNNDAWRNLCQWKKLRLRSFYWNSGPSELVG